MGQFARPLVGCHLVGETFRDQFIIGQRIHDPVRQLIIFTALLDLNVVDLDCGVATRVFPCLRSGGGEPIGHMRFKFALSMTSQTNS